MCSKFIIVYFRVIFRPTLALLGLVVTFFLAVQISRPRFTLCYILYLFLFFFLPIVLTFLFYLFYIYSLYRALSSRRSTVTDETFSSICIYVYLQIAYILIPYTTSASLYAKLERTESNEPNVYIGVQVNKTYKHKIVIRVDKKKKKKIYTKIRLITNIFNRIINFITYLYIYEKKLFIISSR